MQGATTFNSAENILFLMPSGNQGCIPNRGAEGNPPWQPAKNTLFAIVNQSGAPQTLSGITADVIKQQDGQNYPLDTDNSTNPATKTLTIEVNGVWIGRVGNPGSGGNPQDPTSGTFLYEDGYPGGGMRTGTINPG